MIVVKISMLRVCLFVVLLVNLESVKAQDVRILVDQQMEIAREQMNAGEYEKANKTFRQILKMNTVLPHDLSYLFAETLYMVGQYENSDNFLKRYIQLTGKGGNYAVQAEQLRALLDGRLDDIKICQFCDINGYRLITCSRCNGSKIISDQCDHCNGHGALTCHVCLGDGVLIAKTDFSTNEYKTCNRCSGKGVETCPVCKGEKILAQKCPLCTGTGLETSGILCDHTPHDPN